MANTTIKIKRSFANSAPPSLLEGELAYSFVSNTLFIGDQANTPRQIYSSSFTDSAAANTVRVSANSGSEQSKVHLNFVNTSSVLTSVVPGSSGNANIAFSVASNLDITALSTAYIDFDKLPYTQYPGYVEGRMWYNLNAHSIQFQTDFDSFDAVPGQIEYVRVYNNTGVQIDKGKPLYITGVKGSADPVDARILTVAVAAANDGSKKDVVALAGHNIPNGSEGFGLIRGPLYGIDTSGLTAGQRFHLGITAGTLTSVAPEYPNWPMDIGQCLTKDAVFGSVYVDIIDHSFERIRVLYDGYVGGNFIVEGDLTVFGTQNFVSASDFYVGGQFLYLDGADAINVASTVFTGSGLNDMTFKGIYEGDPASTNFYVRIASAGVQGISYDTFDWSYNSSFSPLQGSGISITGTKQELANGISVQFVSVLGHTVGDQWSGTAYGTNRDFGIIGHYNDGSYKHAGLFRDSVDGDFKFFTRYVPEPAGNIDASNSTFQLGNVRVDRATANSFVTNTGINLINAINSAANTVRVSANGGSTLSAKQLNFVNSPNVLVSIADSGTGNANVSFTANISATEILNKLLTVDGIGSGLDADLLDGKSSNTYGRLVVTTATGGASDANYWAKIATANTGTTQFSDASIIFAVTAKDNDPAGTAIVSATFRSSSTGNDPRVDVKILSLHNPGWTSTLSIGEDSFKVISGGWSTDMELWFQKKAVFSNFNFYVISENIKPSTVITYNDGATWQLAEPTGAVNNVRSTLSILPSSSASRILYSNGYSVATNTNLTFNATTQLFSVGSALTANAISGSVGVGTTTPQYLLDVGGRMRAANIVLGNTIGTLYGDDNLIRPNNSSAFLNIKGGAGLSKIALGDSILDLVSGGNVGITFRTQGGTNNGGVLRATIDANGNVGIGTSTPNTRLHVQSGSSGISYVPNGRTVATFDSNTTNGTTISIISPNTGISGILFGKPDNEALGQIQLDHTSGSMRFATSGAEKVRIDASGNLGIGTTSPAAKLDANGDARITGNTTIINTTAGDALRITQTGTGNVIVFEDETNPDATPFVIRATGDVGIGTVNPQYKLEVNGAFAATTKSFIIDHPTKPGKRLRYASLEGPENGVYVRGRNKGSSIIYLPEYWHALVDQESITVSLTPIGKNQKLFVDSVSPYAIIVASDLPSENVDFFYVVFAERKDVDKLQIEV